MEVEPVTIDVLKEDVAAAAAAEELGSSKSDAVSIFLEDLKDHAKFIEKSVSTRDNRFCHRVMLALTSTRKRLSATALRKMVSGFYGPQATEQRNNLLSFIDAAADEENRPRTPEVRSEKKPASKTPPALLPEHDAYFNLLVLIYLLDQKCHEEAVRCSDYLVEKIGSLNRRSMDVIAAKAYFYLSRSYELAGRFPDIRHLLLSRLRTSTLRKDVDGQAVLLNCLLRNYLHCQLFSQAAKLVEQSTFPKAASNNEWARYHYYTGLIEAIQLSYSDSYGSLLRAIRYAPQTKAVGFKQTVHKLAVTVELLLGDIPDRAVFKTSYLRYSLLPYLQLTQAVRYGDLGHFNEVVENFKENFEDDGTYTLITRLRHNVIRAGLRMINMSYLRIHFSDIAAKLKLDNPEDTEYIVAKAIRDGVIEGRINHDEGYLESTEIADVYCTREPQVAFHNRIKFCLDLHNQSIMALRYPPKASAEEERPKRRDVSWLFDDIILDFDQMEFEDDGNGDIF